MVFSSSAFLFLYLPCVCLLYAVLPWKRARNVLLAVVSVLFYAFGMPVYVLLLLLSVGMNYGFGLLAAREGVRGRVGVALAVAANLLLLGVFKYTDFLVGIGNGLFGTALPLPGIALPIGISFFTFQALSYVVDTHREPSLCQRDPMKLLLYIAFFPQLIAGPIVRYGDIAAEIENRRASPRDVAQGLRRFVFGLAKKLLLANTVGAAADTIFAMNGGVAVAAWAGAALYCLQIYYDFSGYSDMAIGLGRVFGFHFRENFDHPYAAGSVKDFWRRWHISLSSWFKSYLYIPLGGNRRGALRTVLNKYAVFFCTGLWHGASWNFVLWGLIHGTCLVLEDRAQPLLRRCPGLWRCGALLVVALSFVLFRAETLTSAMAYYGTMFADWRFTGPEMSRFLASMTPWTAASAVTGAVLALPMGAFLRTRLGCTGTRTQVVSYAAAFLLLALCVLNLASAEFNPFIYFRF